MYYRYIEANFPLKIIIEYRKLYNCLILNMGIAWTKNWVVILINYLCFQNPKICHWKVFSNCLISHFLFSLRYNNVIFSSSFYYCIWAVVLHLFFDTFIVIAIIVSTIHFRAQYNNTIVYYIPNRSTVTFVLYCIV